MNHDDLSSLESFDGRVRLFPLPNLVLFPHMVQPLHIFEPRYREMTADALAGDRLIALVLLRPGWEAGSQAQPAIHPVACLGKIIGDQRWPDGRFNLLLRGIVRVRIEEQLVTGKPYRSARVKRLPDRKQTKTPTQASLRRKLADLLPEWFANQPRMFAKQIEKLVQSDLPLGAVCDAVSCAVAARRGIQATTS